MIDIKSYTVTSLYIIYLLISFTLYIFLKVIKGIYDIKSFIS